MNDYQCGKLVAYDRMIAEVCETIADCEARDARGYSAAIGALENLLDRLKVLRRAAELAIDEGAHAND